MFNFFKRKQANNEIMKIVNEIGIDNASKLFATHIDEYIPNHHVAYEFIMQELDGARQGNYLAKKFVEDSGVSKNEYLNKLLLDSDADEASNALNIISSFINHDMELSINIRLKILENIMMKYKIGKFSNNISKNSSISSNKILCILHKGDNIYIDQQVYSYKINHEEGRIIEVMFSFSNEEFPYFVYYFNEEYYNKISWQLFSPGETYSTLQQKNVQDIFIQFIHIMKGIKVDVSKLGEPSYTHNKINTNTLIYIDSLDDWYPIRHSKKEGESAAKDKVHKINYENKDVTDYISIRNISPS